MYETEHFKYMLKTDDDCYVDVKKIHAGLKKHENTTKLWWGR